MPPAKSHTDPPRSKKRRINFACNYCRARKTRCDERKPYCNACQAAGVHCVTTDKRRPDKSVDRHEAGRQRRSTPSVSDDASPVNQLIPKDDAGQQLTSYSPGRLSFPTNLALPEIGYVDDLESQHQIPNHGDKDGDESPLNQPSPSRFQGRLPLVGKTIGNSSVEIASDWLDLALYRLGLRQVPTKSWEHRRTDMMSLSDASLFDQWELPNQVSPNELLECFFQGPNLIFPLLEWKECMAGLEQCLNSSFFEFVQRNGPSRILQLLAVLVLGYISGPHQISGFNVGCYLNRCRTMLGHVMRYPSIATLKSLILFLLALKSSNKLLEACHTVILAASIATSLGLNQQTTRSPERTSLEYPMAQEKKRLWVYVYTIKKLLAFELGRHSNLRDIQEAELPDTLGCKELFELARLLSGIGKWSVRASRQDETDRDDELYQSICDLLISKEALQSAVGVIAKDKPWYSVIRNGQSMVADAARKTLRLVIEGVDSDFNAAFSSLTAPLNSLATLVVSIITRSRSHVAGTDLSLIETAANALRELHCWNIRGNNDLGSLLDRLVRLSIDSIKAARHSRAAASSIGASEGRIPLLSIRSEPRSGGPDQTGGMSWPVTASLCGSQDELRVGSLFGDGSQLWMLKDDDVMWFDNWTSTFPDEISWDWSKFPQIFQSQAQSSGIEDPELISANEN
ncbi:unnamed protein product [Clonostachys rhizophaga]|uniref:Zn(2)-C6 fungal-type domain-containing protein n=1 Tax=Clonostachys rhizophaga TaxID=160324 RepID=A0A9N9VH91_9HYPO|nr:unnamed protein product [Clonostachys rhizophaga]